MAGRAGQSYNFTNEPSVETAQKKARVVELRRKRWLWHEIAAEVGCSRQYVKKIYEKALAEIPAGQVDEHRAEELMLIDDAVRNLLEIATDANGEHVSHRSRIEAWSTIRAWAERKAKLLGLDAPTQTVSIDKIDAEIMALTRELDAMANAGEDVTQ